MPPVPIRRPAPRLQAHVRPPSMPWVELLGFAVMMTLALSLGA